MINEPPMVNDLKLEPSLGILLPNNTPGAVGSNFSNNCIFRSSTVYSLPLAHKPAPAQGQSPAKTFSQLISKFHLFIQDLITK